MGIWHLRRVERVKGEYTELFLYSKLLYCLRVIKMKKILINQYYNLLMYLEDVFDGIGTAINNHRKCIDDRYWCKYIALQNNKSFKADSKKDAAA